MLRRVMMAVSGSAFSWLTFDPTKADASVSLSSGNRTATGVVNNGGQVLAVNPKSSGKWYVETTVDVYNVGVGSSGIGIIGLSTSAAPLSDYLGQSSGCCGFWGVSSSSTAYLAGTAASPGFGVLAPGDIIQLAWDADAGRVWYGRNGSWSGNPSTGASPTHSSATLTGLHYAASGPRNVGNRVTLRSSPAFPMPSGFSMWSAS